MTAYTIQVINQSGVDKSYVIFIQPPPTFPGSVAPIYADAWATFANVTDGDRDSVVYTPEDAEVAKGSPAPRIAVAEGAYAPGQVIEPSDVGKVATIDFEGRRQTTAFVTEHPNGDFSVAYA
jgi:hypothetical protein